VNALLSAFMQRDSSQGNLEYLNPEHHQCRSLGLIFRSVLTFSIQKKVDTKFLFIYLNHSIVNLIAENIKIQLPYWNISTRQSMISMNAHIYIHAN
jgi:hypothetical protein